MNLLVTLTGRGQVVQYVTKNAAPRAVYESKLTGVLTKTRISNLFTGSGSYTETPKNTFDTLIVDEAHRLNEKSGLFQNIGHNQIKELIESARLSVFFIDEDPEAKLEFLNRGVSGNTVLDLEKRWQKDTLDLKPDVLSVLIGVNDKGRGVPFDEYEQTYDRLLAVAKAANPKLKLVLCEPFVVNHLATTPQHGAPNSDIVRRQEIVRRLAKKHGAALVDFQGALDRATKRAPAIHWIWDDVHPTYSGHQILADEWERTVREFSQ